MRPLASILAAALLFFGSEPVDAAGKSGRSHKSQGKKGGRRGARKRRPPAPPPMPSRLEVVAVDPAVGGVRVALLGPARPPETRLFVLTDERGRRFVPATAECQPTSPLPPSPGKESSKESSKESGKPPSDGPETPLVHWQCALTIAPSYRRAALTGVSMEWGDRIVSALPGQVRSRWAEAGSTLPPIPPAADTSPEPATPQPTEPGSTASPGSLSGSGGDHHDDGTSDDDDSEME